MYTEFVDRVRSRLPGLGATGARLVRRAGFPPLSYWPAALPGAACALEWAWGRTLRRTPAVAVEHQAARVGVGEIEEVIGCALCGSRTVQPVFRPAHRQWSYHVVRCRACGFLFRSPGVRPSRVGELYAHNYSRFLAGEYAKGRQRRYAVVLDGFQPLFSHGDGRRLLDFGCGVGDFLELAYRRGFDGYGVDLSPDSVKAARTRQGGAKTYVGSPRDTGTISAGGFDVITMWSVLAHLPRPVEDLTMLRKLLTPDGVLLIFTVNANALLLKAARSEWGGFTRNHLMFYAPDTLRILLRRAGFGAVVTHPHYGDVIELGELRLSGRLHERALRNIADGNRGHMFRAVAFLDPEGPARWELSSAATVL